MIYKDDTVNTYKMHREMIRVLPDIDQVYRFFNQELVITSANDGKHMTDSLHYKGNAIDARTFYFKTGEKELVTSIIRTKLGPDFDVVLESDHIHIEYDPK